MRANARLRPRLPLPDLFHESGGATVTAILSILDLVLHGVAAELSC
jgi:hypothetical protein